MELRTIPIADIHTKENYRKTFHEASLVELAGSIKENGVLDPVTVRPNNTGFELVAGERRYRAAQLAGLATIPALVRDVADEKVLLTQLVENVQREGVPFIEEADAIRRLREELGLDVTEIAKTLGKSEPYIYRSLQVANMDEEARRLAKEGWLSKAVTWEIARLKTPSQQYLAANALARTKRSSLVSVDATRRYIKEQFGDEAKVRKASKPAGYYSTNWKAGLLKFDGDQFEDFKRIVRGRTDMNAWAEAVELVLQKEEEAGL